MHCGLSGKRNAPVMLQRPKRVRISREHSPVNTTGFIYKKGYFDWPRSFYRGAPYRYPSLSNVASTMWRPASVPSMMRRARTESPMLRISVSSPSKPSTMSFQRGA